MRGWIKLSGGINPTIIETLTQNYNNLTQTVNNLINTPPTPIIDVSVLKTRYLYPHNTDKRKIVLKTDKAPLTFKVGNKNFIFTESITIDPVTTLDTGTWTEAKDYNIYLCDTGNGYEFKTSLNTTYPAGYNTDNSRRIGGFHTLCENVPTITGHPLSEYQKGDILPNSIWDINHRPVSSPAGMIYVEALKKWVDIYIASYDGNTLISQKTYFPTTSTFYTFIARGHAVKKEMLDLFEILTVNNYKPPYRGYTSPNGGATVGDVRCISFEGMENTGGIDQFYKIIVQNISISSQNIYLDGQVTEIPVYFDIDKRRFVANIPQILYIKRFTIYPDPDAANKLPVYINYSTLCYGGSTNYGTIYVHTGVCEAIEITKGILSDGERLHVDATNGKIGSPNGVWATTFSKFLSFGDEQTISMNYGYSNGYTNDKYINLVGKFGGDILEMIAVDKFSQRFARFSSKPL